MKHQQRSKYIENRPPPDCRHGEQGEGDGEQPEVLYAAAGGRGGRQLQLQLQAEQREERGQQARHLRQPEQVVGEHQQLQPGLHSGLVMGDVRGHAGSPCWWRTPSTARPPAPCAASPSRPSPSHAGLCSPSRLLVTMLLCLALK